VTGNIPFFIMAVPVTTRQAHGTDSVPVGTIHAKWKTNPGKSVHPGSAIPLFE
jgi:hypothetical protein